MHRCDPSACMAASVPGKQCACLQCAKPMCCLSAVPNGTARLALVSVQAVLVDCDAGQRRSLMDLLQRYRCGAQPHGCWLFGWLWGTHGGGVHGLLMRRRADIAAASAGAWLHAWGGMVQA